MGMFSDDPDDEGTTAFFLQARQREEERETLDAMRGVAARVRVSNLLDEINKEHLVTLGMIMRSIACDPDGRATAQHMAGQIATLCRVVHKICCSCGSDTHTGEHHELVDMAPPKSPIDRPLSYHEAVSLVSGPASLMMEYNVYEVPGDGANPTHLRCVECGAAFANIAFRVKQGADCPSCLTPKRS